jgi:uncharacterized protein YdgA (DUF945 family)
VWQGMDVNVDYSHHFDNMTMKGGAPGIKFSDNTGSEIAIDKIHIDANLKRQFESLYVGDELFTIGTMTVKQSSDNGSGAFIARDIAYRVDMNAKDEWFNVGAKMGAAAMDATQFKIKDAHFDFAMNHLHGPTLNTLFKAYQDMAKQMSQTAINKPAVAEDSAAQSEPAAESLTPTDDPTGATAAQEQLAKLKPHMIELLKHDPEMVFEHIGFGTDEGAIKITGRAQFNGIDAADLEPEFDPAKLVSKLAAEADITLAQGLVDHWPFGMTPDSVRQSLAQLEQQGLIVRKGDQWQSHLEFKRGELTANGKKVGQ